MLRVIDGSDRLFVSIGVSRPKWLDPLPGAITAAQRMADWAFAQKYTTLHIDDDGGREVTTDLLRSEISAAIDTVTQACPLGRIVLFFAGHGAALSVRDQYWILTNWKTRPTEAIKMSSLQRALEYYGPTQVSVIGDSCQEFSSKFIDIIGSSVLDTTDEEPRSFELDQFFAADVAKQAFMVKASNDAKDFCLFTEVLLDALEGDAVDVCYEDTPGGRVVTSQSLTKYLNGAVAREAGKHGLRMTPHPSPGFYTDRIYLRLPSAADPFDPPDTPGSDAAAGYLGVSESLNGLHTAFPEGLGDLQRTPAPGRRGRAVAPVTPEDWARLREQPGRKERRDRRRSVEKIDLVAPLSPPELPEVADRRADLERDERRRALVDEIEKDAVREHFETGCGICISGAAIVPVEASHARLSRVATQPNWIRVHLPQDDLQSAWTDTLVTLRDGQIVPICAIWGFISALHVGEGLSLTLLHRPFDMQSHQAFLAIDLLARLHTGDLSREDIVDAAARLRDEKHEVITIGCIVAQFYDVIRDVDSLRNMAYFYAARGQPIPLDIILYGGGTLSSENGRLYATIKAVQLRQARSEGERIRPFTSAATPEVWRYPVAGRIPWMRQAWGALATVGCDASAASWRKDALAAMDFLGPGLFSSIRPAGRRAIARLASPDGKALSAPLETF